MRVVTLQYLAYRTCTFTKLLRRLQTHLVHGIKHATMDWFEAITNVWQCTADNNAHRVIEIGISHFFYNVDWLNIAWFHKKTSSPKKVDSAIAGLKCLSLLVGGVLENLIL